MFPIVNPHRVFNESNIPEIIEVEQGMTEFMRKYTFRTFSCFAKFLSFHILLIACEICIDAIQENRCWRRSRR